MTVKLTSICTAAVLWISALAGTAWCKNYVYKGTIVDTNSVTGETLKLPTYLIFGDARNVDVRDDYQFVDSKAVLVSAALLGKKRFLRQSGHLFRSLRQTVTVDGKPRTSVILTFSDAADTTSLDGGHFVTTVVLSGLVTDERYSVPLKLTGTTLRSTGQSHGTDESTGVGGTQKWKFTLVRDLTDPIPPEETLAQTVDRVAAFLMSRGFIEFVPG